MELKIVSFRRRVVATILNRFIQLIENRVLKYPVTACRELRAENSAVQDNKNCFITGVSNIFGNNHQSIYNALKIQIQSFHSLFLELINITST